MNLQVAGSTPADHLLVLFFFPSVVQGSILARLSSSAAPLQNLPKVLKGQTPTLLHSCSSFPPLFFPLLSSLPLSFLSLLFSLFRRLLGLDLGLDPASPDQILVQP